MLVISLEKTYRREKMNNQNALEVNAFAETPWGKANEAFYKWERDCVGESSLSDDDRRVWVQGYLQALRDVEVTND